MSASTLLSLRVELKNITKSARMLCMGDFVVYDGFVTQVKDVVFMEERKVQIEFEENYGDHVGDFSLIVERDQPFNVVTPAITPLSAE